MLPKNIITDLAEMRSWISTIADPNEFQRAYASLSAGRSSGAIEKWLAACETLSKPSTNKAYYPRTNRFQTRDDLMQHGRIAAFSIANQVMDGDLVIHGQPIRYAWTSIKHGIHQAAFGKPRSCDCRVGGKCTAIAHHFRTLAGV